MSLTNSSYLEGVVEKLDDPLNTYLSKCNSYREVQNALEKGESISAKAIEILLAICVRDLKQDMQYTACALSVIFELLKYKLAQYSPIPDLLPSALAVVNIMKVVSQINKADALLVLCFETLLLYPENILLVLVTSHRSDLIEIIDTFAQKPFNEIIQPVKFSILVFKLLGKVLQLLSPEQKQEFVREGLAIWFSKIIPNAVSMIMSNVDFDEHVEMLEMLVDALVPIDYAENPHWKVILEKIYNSKKYPALMQKLLENGNDVWYRLWIIFIKLLKNQITKVGNSSGSPINALLPVVEWAFKLSPKIRCQAFKCWDVLIDNFSAELNEAHVNKRLKLLIVPLRSSNAKVAETAIAKLNTWWHLMTQFHSKMDKFVDMIVIPFLHFCFGKQHSSGRVFTAPGQFTDNIKRQCLQALVEIIGHVDCEGCVTLPRLKGRLISTNVLVNNWNDWVYSLKIAIKFASSDSTGKTTQQMTCLWKGFATTIGELPDNNIRKDLFNAFLEIITEFQQDCVNNDMLSDIVFNVMIHSLFDDKDKFKHLLKMKGEQFGPIHTILRVLINPSLDNFYNRKDANELVNELKPISNFIMDDSVSCPDRVIEWLLNKLPVNNNTLMLWTAVVESIYESKYELYKSNLKGLALWPLQLISIYSNVKSSVAWYNWFTLYNLVHPKLNDERIDDHILKILWEQNKLTSTTSNFMLCATLAVLKNKLIMENSTELISESELFVNVMEKVNDYQSIEKSFPILVDTLVLMLNKIAESSNTPLATCTITTVKTVLKLTNPVLKIKNYANILIFIENLLKPLQTVMKMESYPFNLKTIIVDELIECASHIHKGSSLQKIIFSILKMILPNSTDVDMGLCKTVKSAVALFEKDIDTDKRPPVNQDSGNNFMIPDTKGSSKKSKKKEASIVNTIVEDGEEFVVVKSNWKFNPKKLTENQKEKFKRKREDIPALYQDLSQSQDEFKLTAWKTDSQDTTTTSGTNSKSTSKTATEDVSIILKDIPSSNVVPKIMENILSDNDKMSTKGDEKSNVAQETLAVKDTKSPRMALKDRVFRNVRNLIEKSNLQNDDKLRSENFNQTVNENVLKTPPTKTKAIVPLVNSAPPKITTERPSRIIKKPKKFDDSEIYVLKKRRRSQNDSQPTSKESEKPVQSIHMETKDDENSPENKNNSSNISMLIISNEKTVNIDNCDDKVPKTCVENIDITQSDVSNKETVLAFQKSDEKMDVDKEVTVLSASCEEKEIKKTDNICTDHIEKVSTPKAKNKETDEQKSSAKKKTSRIEKQLLIDMVEGHPYLQVQSEMRLTRNALLSPASNIRRKCLVKKRNQVKVVNKNDKKLCEKDKSNSSSGSSSPVTGVDSQDKLSECSQDLPQSEDVIESSQDSAITTISMKSSKHISKKLPIVELDNNISIIIKTSPASDNQKLLQNFSNDIVSLSDSLSVDPENKDDTELPKNKTMEEENCEMDLTENMDTEPIEDKDSSGEVIIINEDEPPFVINTSEPYIGPDTLEIAEADTQHIDIENETTNVPETICSIEENSSLNDHKNTSDKTTKANESTIVPIADTQNEMTEMISDSLEVLATVNTASNGTCSPLKHDDQRKKDFLNDTIEISPIKTMSPVREKKSPSPEDSRDYVVIKLTSPVQINGEPFEKCESPEIFTEEKISPDKRDQSPPRVEIVTHNTSPSSCLSLKKNKPQVRSNGRAAQMLGLCVPDKLQAVINSDISSDSEESKKNSPLITPARRNLRILNNPNESEDSEKFLKFKRSIPAVDSSPAGPILKRKLADIVDEITMSPANKRKRVSFHDPPVSTTVAVQKYIEPGGVRSPQSSTLKRLERQSRPHTVMKSPKRLDNVFKLDTVLTKTVESFTEEPTVASIDDTEMSSMDQTPAVEVVKTSDLNDTDPICSDLLYCNDPIDNIASELSSLAMKDLFIMELKGKVETIADLAKMTELEVNRLCIKTPKVKLAKKVLADYASKKAKTQEEQNVIDEPNMEETIIKVIPEVLRVNVEVQTNDALSKNSETQTVPVPMTVTHTQTEIVPTAHTSVQTDESGNKSTKDVIASCLLERPDFMEQLSEQLDEPSMRRIADKLSFDASIEMLTNKIQRSALNSDEQNGNKSLSFLQDYICSRFGSKDLILFCSQVLRKIHDKPI